MQVPASLTRLADILDAPLYIAGGYVRNACLGYQSSDIDIASPLHYEKVIERLKGTEFSAHLTSPKMFTLKITAGNDSFEFTTFRTESYTKGHTPTEVSATESIVEDAKRRDFTMNAVYYDVKKGALTDPLGGIKDIERRLVVATRSPDKVFAEDGLRLMRLARQSSELGFEIEDATLEGAKKNAFRIDEISPERIRDELDKILIADTKYGVKNAQVTGLKRLLDIGVLARILPEITDGIGITQRADFHSYDVFYHTLATVEGAKKDIRLAALLHDVGKPYVYKKEGTFHRHDEAGAEIAEAILTRLRYPKSVIRDVKTLVALHMFNLQRNAKENKVRAFTQKYERLIFDLADLMDADAYGTGKPFNENSGGEFLRETYKKMRLENVPFKTSDLLINGEDLISLGVEEEERGKVLEELLRECAMKNSRYTTKEKQLEFVKAKRKK